MWFTETLRLRPSRENAPEMALEKDREGRVVEEEEMLEMVEPDREVVEEVVDGAGDFERKSFALLLSDIV